MRALVIHGGQTQCIPRSEWIRGDILILSTGDRGPADACVLSSTSIETDESLLTGESFPAREREHDSRAAGLSRPDGNDPLYGYADALVVQGRGLL